ncbi:uncharacterized protein AKAME5_000340800 [Lates japonicus]|uniref:Uncharacterized protein n=1 Tax=Lates japonicus TaxID=270547 RepID=A0AAD3M8U4_LATJO|nr:uncharacterized protein AKAME5_000340800 [Lates japonicus]
MERSSPFADASPASILPTSGITCVEHQADRPGLLPCQGEPRLGKTHPLVSCLLSPDDTVPIGQLQLTAANMDTDTSQTINLPIQQAAVHPCELVQQQIEQIHKVLQEQSRLLTLLGAVVSILR